MQEKLDKSLTLGPKTELKNQRDPKDIIVVANTCGTYMFNLCNGIPMKEYVGSK